MVVWIDITRGLVFELEATFFQRLDNLLSMSQWHENVIGKVCCDKEDGSVIQSAAAWQVIQPLLTCRPTQEDL
jgi:hypothetical protein